MKELGGYFESEILSKQNINLVHFDYVLKSGRSSLSFIIKISGATRIFLPDFLCPVILEPLIISGIELVYYSIDHNLEIDKPIEIGESELLLYINYFGVKSQYAQLLQEKYREKLIIDDTHNFFNWSTNDLAWRFNSIRKFIGVPDGSVLFVPKVYSKLAESKRDILVNENYEIDHLELRKNLGASNGYDAYVTNEKLVNSEIEYCGDYTSNVLGKLDFDEIKLKRKKNFRYLHCALQKKNNFSLGSEWVEESNFVPFCYTYKPDSFLEHKLFWDNGIFVPVLWSTKESQIKSSYNGEELLHFPIDHRYDLADMDYILEKIEHFEKRR